MRTSDAVSLKHWRSLGGEEKRGSLFVSGNVYNVFVNLSISTSILINYREEGEED